MKTRKLLALVLSALMLVGMLVACGGSGAKTNVTLTLKIDAENSTLFDATITVDAKNPTVADVIEEAALSHGLDLNWTDMGSLTMPDYPDMQNEDGTYEMWICKVNGTEGSSDTVIKEGDKIVYTYTHYIPKED